MAGDWIKMRIDLMEDPAVMEMADKLDVREEVIVGYCHAFWSWVSRQCHGDTVTGVTLASLGRRLNVPGFPELLCDVGWLEYDDTGDRPEIRIPKIERHLSQSAKSRATAADRKSRQRKSHASVAKVSHTERDKSVTREEKRREEKTQVSKRDTCAKEAPKSRPASVDEVMEYTSKREIPIDAEQFFDHYTANGWVQARGKPIRDWRAAVRTWERNGVRKTQPASSLDLELPFAAAEFANAWADFIQMRSEIEKPLGPTAAKVAIETLSKMGLRRSITALQYTTGNQWQGIQEPEGNQLNPSPRPKRPTPVNGESARFRLVKVFGVSEARDWDDTQCLSEYRQRVSRSAPGPQS